MVWFGVSRRPVNATYPMIENATSAAANHPSAASKGNRWARAMGIICAAALKRLGAVFSRLCTGGAPSPCERLSIRPVQMPWICCGQLHRIDAGSANLVAGHNYCIVPGGEQFGGISRGMADEPAKYGSAVRVYTRIAGEHREQWFMVGLPDERTAETVVKSHPK